MTTSYTVRDAAEELLVLFAQADAGGEPTPEQIGDLIASYSEPGPDLAQYLAGHKGQARGARTGFMLGTDAMGRVAATSFGLSARLLAWSAWRTGLSAAEVIASLLGHEDVEEG